jgi:hypothetical protein
VVKDKKRNERLRLLISRLNKERKKQAKQIDILCNDLIAAQKDFIKGLNTIRFAADFYEQIAGTIDLNELLYAAGKFINERIHDATVAFFVQHPDNFELHIFESDKPIGPEDRRLENCFTTELVGSISRSNKVCMLEDMFALGLEGNPAQLDKISAYAVPLADKSIALGFTLVYRSSQDRLTNDELKCICGITPGLSRAITACKTVAHAAK